MIEYGISKGYEKHHQLLKYKIDLSRKKWIPSHSLMCVGPQKCFSQSVFTPVCKNVLGSTLPSQVPSQVPLPPFSQSALPSYPLSWKPSQSHLL